MDDQLRSSLQPTPRFGRLSLGRGFITLIPIAVVGALVSSGCASREGQCVSQEDCSSLFTCVDGTCVAALRPNPGFVADSFDAGQRNAGRTDAGRADAGRLDAGQAIDAHVGICGPAACEAQGAECGSIVDDCGGTVECAPCETGFECGTGAFQNQCQCVPRTCEELGAQCGRIDDGCGQLLECGSCSSNQSCGAEEPNRCGCPSGQQLCNGQCVTRCGETFTTAGTHTYRVPNDCRTLRIVARGAGGGHGRGNTRGAAGGYARAEFDVRGGQNLTVVVGGPGRSGAQTSNGRAPGGAGGAPGGGTGGDAGGLVAYSGGGGGGFSGVFEGSVAQGDAWIMAGGGGGSGGSNGRIVGAGGGASGQDGDAGGGTQSAGGAGGSAGQALQGGGGGNQTGGDGGGGGGGGYFGGGGGRGANNDGGGGGGGSGFVASEGRNRLLASGSRGTPPRANEAGRGSAGDPQSPGLISVDCL